MIEIAFQSTHPRGVRLDGHNIVALSELVSIHAPAWGATPDYASILRFCTMEL